MLTKSGTSRAGKQAGTRPPFRFSYFSLDDLAFVIKQDSESWPGSTTRVKQSGDEQTGGWSLKTSSTGEWSGIKPLRPIRLFSLFLYQAVCLFLQLGILT